MPVVAHHPVIIHFESIAVGWLSVDEDLVVFDLEVMEFVSVDDTLIQWKIVQCELHGLTFAWNLDGTEVVHIPRIEVRTVGE